MHVHVAMNKMLLISQLREDTINEESSVGKKFREWHPALHTGGKFHDSNNVATDM